MTPRSHSRSHCHFVRVAAGRRQSRSKKITVLIVGRAQQQAWQRPLRT